MRRIAVALVLSVLAAAPAAAPAQPRHFAGELIVKFRPSADARERARARARVDASMERTLGRRDLQLVELAPGRSVRAARAALERAPEVEYAEPNYRLVPDATVNDPRYASQWHLARTGVPAAWDVTMGSRDVVVAVLDSGVAIRHPDLRDNAWTNPGETGSGRESNRVDDDGNGYVDDWGGWDFGGEGPPYENEPNDYSGHGTAVAGLLGAVGDNGVGITGVSPRVRIMPLAVWGRGTAGLVEAIAYADSFGVRVANGSFGIAYSQAVDDALAAAPGLLLTVSAGNEAWDVETHKDVRYPCASPLPNVICVAATDGADNLAGFSNWGAESVDLGAPGTDLPTTGLPQRQLFYDALGGPLDTSRWTVGGTGAAWDTAPAGPEWLPDYGVLLHDSPGEPYPNDADTWIGNAQPIDLTGGAGCGISYSYLRDLATEGDRFLVEASADGVPWTTLLEMAGQHGPWPQGQHSLEAFEGRPGFRFRFRLITDASGQARGVTVSYVQVFCRHGVFRGDEYFNAGGTSNAAPQVAGTAALLLAARPWLTTAGLRAAILENVEPLPSLAGRTVTGGRLNAHWAVAGRPPPEDPVEPPPPGEPPVSPSGDPPPPLVDRRAPACRLRVRRGLRLAVRCDEAARLRARAVLRRGRRPVVGYARGTLRGPGTRALRIRLARRWQGRRLRLELRVVATDAAGNRRTLVRRVTRRG